MSFGDSVVQLALLVRELRADDGAATAGAAGAPAAAAAMHGDAGAVASVAGPSRPPRVCLLGVGDGATLALAARAVFPALVDGVIAIAGDAAALDLLVPGAAVAGAPVPLLALEGGELVPGGADGEREAAMRGWIRDRMHVAASPIADTEASHGSP